ncbi:MAG: GDSL-type esterase/lipase family protein, partial [Bacteroidota bacterium]
MICRLFFAFQRFTALLCSLCLVCKFVEGAAHDSLQFVASKAYLVDSCQIYLESFELKASRNLDAQIDILARIRKGNLSEITKSYPLHPLNVSYRNTTSNSRSDLKSPQKESNKEGVNDSKFVVLHIGDSHVQGGHFSNEIRRHLQAIFGYGGRGMIFPYSLAKSYGPRGLIAKKRGDWEGYNVLNRGVKSPLGLSGYALQTLIDSSELSIRFDGKFREEFFGGVMSDSVIHRLNLWHSAGENSYDFSVNDYFSKFETFLSGNQWGVTTFTSSKGDGVFRLKTVKNKTTQNQFQVYGVDHLPVNDRGVRFYQCGVVGAQFTHFTKNAGNLLSQIAYLKPNLIIFSLGTNEAYNNQLDSIVYIHDVGELLKGIQSSCPATAIILTSAPDTRSQNRVPPMQSVVNRQLRQLAINYRVNFFDLHRAMGGDGSLHRWLHADLVLKDKLHFNPRGYGLQGKLLVWSLMNVFRHNNPEILPENYVLTKEIVDEMRLLNPIHRNHENLD